MPRRAIRRVMPRLTERLLQLMLLAGAASSFWLYRRLPTPFESSRSIWEIDSRDDVQLIERGPNQVLQSLKTNDGPDIATWLNLPPSDDSEVLTSEWQEARLLSDLPDPLPLVRESRRFQARLRVQDDQKLVVQSVFSPHPAPPPLPKRFEYYTTVPFTPLVGEVFHSNPRPPCVLFTWAPVPVDKVEYIVEVAKARSFQYFRSFGAFTNHIQLQASKPGDFFWRVRATRGLQASVGAISRYTVVAPPITQDEAKRRRLASRIVQPEAWLADVQICP